MSGTRRIGIVFVAGSLLLPLAACSRTSDGTIIVPRTPPIPTVSMEPARRFIPSWMKRDEPEPAVAESFPPPPQKKAAPRRTARPPVVTTSKGNLACRNVSEGGRIRMVCE